jgi:membrane protein insertase Oxa1/YidC/SpoIIIJ
VAAAAAATTTSSTAVILASASESTTIGPIVLATQAWEMAHTASGLPWWLSIPATAVALRVALLPLTLKAKGAAANFALLKHASETAGVALKQEEEELRQRQREGKTGRDADSPATAPTPTPTANRRWHLTRGYYSLLRRQHGTPSMWWYNLNVFAQVNVFVSMSAALRQMAGAAWPGLSSEGALWFPDLTAPSVVLGTWATPLGVAGLFLPLAILATYMATVDRAAPAAQSRAARAALELASLPVFLTALAVPQATLLYWLPSSAVQLLAQRALDSKPKLASALGVPLLAMRAEGPSARAEIKGLAAARAGALVASAKGGSDAEFLRFLAADRLARGDLAGALLALERLTSASVAPKDAEGWRARGALAARLGKWGEAARAFERAEAELLGDGGAAGRSLSSEELARLRRALLVRAGTAHLNAISSSSRQQASSSSSSSSSLSPEQRRHLDGALSALNRATAGLPVTTSSSADDGSTTAAAEAFDAWVALGTARVLARQWRPAGDAAVRAWQALSSVIAADGGKEERARQLLPLLRRVVVNVADGEAEATDAGAPQRLASAARAAAGAAALAGREGRQVARQLSGDLERAAEALRRRNSGGEAQLAAVERAAEALASGGGDDEGDGGAARSTAA